MVQGNGLVVRLKNINGDLISERWPGTGVRDTYRLRLITANPGTKFYISIMLDDHFDWKDADALFVAIAHDDGKLAHLGKSDYSQAHIIERSGDCNGEYIFETLKTLQQDTVQLEERPYRMPQPVDSTIERPGYRGNKISSLANLSSHAGCVSVYTRRGYKSQNLRLENGRRVHHNAQEGPGVLAAKHKVLRNANTASRAGLECFEWPEPRGEQTWKFHFRNTNEDTRKVSKEIPYSGAVANPPTSHNTNKKRKVGSSERDSRLTAKKAKVFENEDQDDEEVLLPFIGPAIKTEPSEEEEVMLVEGSGQQRSANTNTRASKISEANTRAKKKKELEMRLQEIELEKAALQVKRQLLEYDD